MSNYDEVCLLCNKIEFEVFKIKDLTGKYCGLVSEEEIEKAKQLCNEQNKASQVKFQASAIKRFFESDQFWHNERTKLLNLKVLQVPKAHPGVPVFLLPNKKPQ